MTNVPAHGELFIDGVMDEKRRIIFHINLPSSNGGLLHIRAKKCIAMPHCWIKPIVSERNRNNNYLFLSLFFHIGSRTRRLKWAAFILEKEKGERRLFRLRLIIRCLPFSFKMMLTAQSQ